MKSPRQIFHIVSYLQYPLIVFSLFQYIPFILSLAKGAPDWDALNFALTIYGVSISFSTLQDTTKVQNKFSKNIWENPRKGKFMIIMLACTSLFFILTGLLLFVLGDPEGFGRIAIGILVLGIGLLGMLKAALEIFENHRLDKVATNEAADRIA